MSARTTGPETAAMMREALMSAPRGVVPAPTLNVLLVGCNQIVHDALSATDLHTRIAHVSGESAQQIVSALRSKPCSILVMKVDDASLSLAEEISALLQQHGGDDTPCLFLVENVEKLASLAGRLTGLFDCLLEPVTPALLARKLRLLSLLYGQREQLTEKDRRMLEEIELATRVQSRFMPESLPSNEHVVFSRYHATCAKIGGDLQDVFNLGRGRMGLYIADVAGHGTSAAMLSGSVKMSVEALKEHIDPTKLPVRDLLDPGALLARSNTIFHQGLPAECFVTLMYAVIDPQARILRIGNAGHPYPIVYRAASGEASILRFPSGPALGPLPTAKFPVTGIELNAGDKLLFYTDGLTEAVNEEGVEFGEDRLLKMMKVCGATPPDQLAKTIESELNAYRGQQPLDDDCSLLVVHFL